jgi:hypothetical protein
MIFAVEKPTLAAFRCFDEAEQFFATDKPPLPKLNAF